MEHVYSYIGPSILAMATCVGASVVVLALGVGIFLWCLAWAIREEGSGPLLEIVRPREDAASADGPAIVVGGWEPDAIEGVRAVDL